MTAPRRVMPGATLLVSRRCLGRAFLLRPYALTNDLIGYILAAKATAHGIQLHAFCVMSNHLHLVLTDPLGNLPRFKQDLDSLVARSVNASHGDWETFWAPGSYSAVTLSDPQAILDKAAYVLANPVAAGLVRRGSQWPGLWSDPERIGRPPALVSRPPVFFREQGPMPDEAPLQLHCPPGFDSSGAFRDQLQAALTSLENDAARKLGKQGRSFLGARVVLAQRRHARPTAPDPRRRLNPRVAGRDKWKRIEAIGRLKEFLADYRAAWRAYARGVRETVFPEGTYWMRVAHGVRCAST